MESKLLDSVNTIQTPEGVDIHLRVAGVWPRSVAWVVDLIIRGLIYALLAIISGLLGKFGSGLMLIGFFFMEWFYPVLFEVFNKGMTPGKKFLNIQVLNSDGTPVGWSPSMLRNILRTVDFLPFFYGLGFASMLLNDKFQRLGDLAADTIVVYVNHSTGISSIPEHAAIKPAYELNLKEQQSIIRYAERSQQLSDERMQELAVILNSLDIPEHRMTKNKLLGIANGLLGRK
ncbi:MAG: RDD family protein [Gammaproteobacteria bacterium]|nr:RDD family protein [Gammaproteobacteria bacterium]